MTTAASTTSVDLKDLSYDDIERLLLTDKLFMAVNIVELYNINVHDDNIRNLLQPHMDGSIKIS